jgi:hypothetical protein
VLTDHVGTGTVAITEADTTGIGKTAEEMIGKAEATFRIATMGGLTATVGAAAMGTFGRLTTNS